MARLLFIDPESTGKTAAFHNIIGQKNYMITRETIGINTSTFNIRGSSCRSQGTSITLVDLGGSEKIRGMWSSQFFDTSGALYFIRDLDTLDLAMQLLIATLTATRFPLHVIINNSQTDVASRMEASVKEVFNTYSSSRPLLSCSVCDISVKYCRNKPLKDALQSLCVAAHSYYVANREEIITQQKDALITSFHLNLSADERRQKLLEVRRQNDVIDTQERDSTKIEKAGEVQALAPVIFTTPG